MPTLRKPNADPRNHARANTRDPAAQTSFPPDLLWHALNESAGCAVTILDPDAKFLWVNHAAADMFRTTPNDVIGRSVGEFFSSALAERARRWIREVLAQRVPRSSAHLLAGRGWQTTAYPGDLRGRGAVLLTVSSPVTNGIDVAVLQDAPRDIRRDLLGPLHKLSDRELDVLALLSRGVTNARVARVLHRSVRTVENHCLAMHRKLGTSTRSELIHIAQEARLRPAHRDAKA